MSYTTLKVSLIRVHFWQKASGKRYINKQLKATYPFFIINPIQSYPILLYIKACVQKKAQLCASSACISGYVLSDKEQNY